MLYNLTDQESETKCFTSKLLAKNEINTLEFIIQCSERRSEIYFADNKRKIKTRNLILLVYYVC